MSTALPEFSRRHLLQGAGIGAAALTLAACSSSGPVTPTAAADRSDEFKAVRIDSWETYRNTVGDDFPSLKQYAGTFGVDVAYTSAVKDDNLYFSKVRDQLALGQDIGADAVVLSEWMAARWIRMGYVQEFSHSRMPNVANLRPRFREAPFDPLRNKTMPWRAGFTGLAWNKAEIPEGLTSVSQLWDSSLKGRVGAMSNMQSTLGLIMTDAGVDVSGNWDEPEFSAAVDVLRQHVTSGQIGTITGNQYLGDLQSGKSVAAFAHSADILRLNQEAGDQWGFALPDAGGVLWSQALVIPIGSTRRTHVENFVNYYYQPEVAVEVAAGTHYVSPVDIRGLENTVLDPEIASNRIVFPTPVTLENARAFRHLSQAEEQRYVAQYQTVLLANS